jgi:RHS repeat-associated protein
MSNDVHEIVTLDPDNTGGAPPIALTHDAKGNLTQDAASGGGVTLSYDFANQLRQAVVPSGASRGLVGTHTYRYDALGRRVAKVVDTNADNTPDTTTVFIYNARWQFIAEYAGGAAPTNPTRSRVYSAGYIDEPLAQVEHTGTNAGTYYLHRDKQYCVIGLTNASGAIVETYTYTPYGQRIVRDASFANPTTTSSYAQQVGHQGLLHDAETGLIYNRYRILEPVLGRWLQRDPLRYVDGMSVYEYVRSLPMGWLDPLGNETEGDREAFVCECCKKARAQGLISGEHGAGSVLCCKGRKIACVAIEWKTEETQDLPPGWTDQDVKDVDSSINLARDIMNQCIKAHEKQHFGDTKPCSGGPDLFVPKFMGTRAMRDKVERKAHEVELDCVRKKLGHCEHAKRPSVCKQELRNYFAHALDQYFDYGGNPSTYYDVLEALGIDPVTAARWEGWPMPKKPSEAERDE